MSTIAVAGGSALVLLIAYFTYGRWLAGSVFRIDPTREVPSQTYADGCDFVSTPRSVVFGHHFTSIAGTGPIVGPAIAVFWGWLPALIWILLGSIFIGAVHDFGSLVVSLRNKGQTVGEIAGTVISPRARFLFLLILFFALTVVLAIFGMVIASIFSLYPGSVLAVWGSLPLAVLTGWAARSPGNRGNLAVWSVLSLLTLYGLVIAGTYWLPISLPRESNPNIIWTIILMAYCFIASVVPVQILLQPRDYINSHQLITALALLVAGLFAAGLSGAELTETAPAIMPEKSLPAGAPLLFPFLFTTVACGAVSGFHCLVSSGTSSKQLASEADAQAVGYGSMLLEAFLAIVVVLACCAGTGMGRPIIQPGQGGSESMAVVPADSGETTVVKGRAAWRQYYGEKAEWASFKLSNQLAAFVEGGANFLSAIGLPLQFGIGLISVLAASFAATTLDSATRLQRYVVQELAGAARIKPLTNKYAATGFALLLSLWIAMLPNTTEPGEGFLVWSKMGQGGLLLWPLFGATNQLLAGLALIVIGTWLKRNGRPWKFLLLPTLFMLVVPAAALGIDLFNSGNGYLAGKKWTLATIAAITLGLQIWIVVEGWIAWNRLKLLIPENR